MSLLLKPIRLIVLCGAAFAAGVVYERAQKQELCASLTASAAQSCAKEMIHG